MRSFCGRGSGVRYSRKWCASVELLSVYKGPRSSLVYCYCTMYERYLWVRIGRPSCRTAIYIVTDFSLDLLLNYRKYAANTFSTAHSYLPQPQLCTLRHLKPHRHPSLWHPCFRRSFKGPFRPSHIMLCLCKTDFVFVVAVRGVLFGCERAARRRLARPVKCPS